MGRLDRDTGGVYMLGEPWSPARTELWGGGSESQCYFLFDVISGHNITSRLMKSLFQETSQTDCHSQKGFEYFQ